MHSTLAPAALPRPIVWVSGLVVAAGVAMAVVGALRSGISWDEPFHVMRLRNFFEHGWFALDWAVEGNDATGPDTNTVVYAPVAMLLLHGLCALLGIEGWDTVATTPAAYDVRHLGVVLIGLVGVAAAAGTTRILLRSWGWALFTAAALLALPMWTGHLMFNIKDVPVATGYSLMTLALVSMVAPVHGHRVLRVGCLASGVVLMVGTRPGMASAVVLSLAVLAAGVLVEGRSGKARTALIEAVVGVAIAGVVLALLYPKLFLHPLNLLASTEKSASFRDGREAALGYVPFYVAAQVPVLLLALSCLGLITVTGFVVRQWRTEVAACTRLVLVVAQLAALPLVAIARSSDLYNGLRQLLFASPAWAVLVALGLARALTWGRARGRLRVVAGVALVALVAPVLDQVTLFPYQYTYYNAALDATGVQVPSDYWRTSVAELLPRIPTDGQIVCGPVRSGSDEPALMTAGRFTSDSSVDCRTDELGPLSSAWAAGRMPLTDALPHDEFYVIIDRGHPVPVNCDRLAGVDRTRHLRTVSMSYAARCRLDPQPLGATPVLFVRPVGQTSMASATWAYAPRGWVIRDNQTQLESTQRSASLTFAVPAACATRACDLVLDADPAAGLAASVNDLPAQVGSGAGEISVALPAAATDAWVTFTNADGTPLDLHVRSIRVAPSEKRRS